MSGKYYQKVSGTFKDFYDLCEAQQYTAASWCTNYFKGDTARQQAGTNTTNVTLTDFKVNGTSITAVKKGYMPTPTSFGEFTYPGTYTLTRTESAMTITGPNNYSQTATASNFRGSKIPHEIIIMAVGGGGGGGGNGWWSPGKDKSGYARICGAAGGGGGYAVGRLVLTDSRAYTFYVGGGGSSGKDGASDANSKGNAGSSGGTSYFKYSSTYYVRGYGGSGGTGGDGTGSSAESLVAGVGGSGGSGSKATTYGATGKGGAGNQLSNHNRTASANMTFTTTAGTGAPNTYFVVSLNNDGDGYIDGVKQNHDDLEGNGSYFCGGCSLGYGAWPAKSAAYAGVGGGGGGGSLVTAGVPGGVFLFY
jgi:hypothetical protein